MTEQPQQPSGADAIVLGPADPTADELMWQRHPELPSTLRGVNLTYGTDVYGK